MRRRTLLVAAGSGVLAGCIGDADPEAEPTATPTDCTIDRREPVDPESDELEPKELPERPDEWTASSVKSYVDEYENVYRRHLVFTKDTVAFGHSGGVTDLQEIERGYRVELQTKFYYNEQSDDGEVHADSPYYTVVYLVAVEPWSRLLRVAATGQDSEPSLDDAETMECW